MQKIWLLIFLVFHTYGVRAQNTQYTHFGTQDGLPSNEVYFVHQDTLGYLWFGTDRGLSRFDGYKFVTYTTQNSGLTNNTVLKVFESPDKNLWLACYDGSVSILNPYTNRISEFEFNDTLKKAPYWVEHVVFQDTTLRIFKRSSFTNYFEYDYSHNTIRKSSIQPSRLIKVYNPDCIDSVGYDSTTNQVFQRITLRRLTTDKKEVYLTRAYLNCPTIQTRDKAYFYYSNALYTYQSGDVVKVTEFPTAIHHFYQNKAGIILISTDQGLFSFDTHLNESVNILAETQCSYTSQDFEGNYWITTLNNGIFQLPAGTVSLYENQTIPLGQSKTKALTSNSLGLFIGTSNEIILFVSDSSFHVIELASSIDTLPNKLEIKSLVNYNDTIFGTGNIKITHSQNGFTIAQLPSVMPLAIVHPITPKTYFGAGHVAGYGVFNTNDGKVIVRNDLGQSMVLNISCDQHGNFWLGTVQGVWKVKHDDLEHAEKQRQYRLLKGRVNQIAHIDKGTSLFATDDNGLIVVKDNKEYKLGLNDGLISNSINCLVLDSNTIWVGTTKGVSKIVLTDKIENSYVDFNYDISDGLASNFVHSLAIWNNQLCIGLDGHVQIIPLNKLTNLQSAPKIHFEKILVNHLDSFEFSDTLFDYNQNDISIYYVGISFKKPDNDFYRYRLVRNGDTSTKYTLSNNTSIDFFDLVPGHYVFEVACQNKNNIWSTTQHFGFRITPHFSETLWFKLLIIFLTCIFLLLFISWRFRDIRRKSRQTAQIQQLEFKFKESELAMLRNQMNPHFVFNAMNSILSYVLENDVETAARYIQRFSTLMRSSLEYSADQWLSLSKEIEFLSNYLHIEQLRFPNRFTYDITYSNNIDDPDDISIPSLLVQPIVENAVKHAFGANTTDGHIAVHFEKEDLYLICTITDNGIGINHSRTQSKVKPKSFGIQVVTNRLKLLNLEGAEALLTIIDRSSESDNAHGTRVTIRIPTD